MRKILFLLPILLSIHACGTQPLPTQDVNKIVNATLTAIAQNNSQVVVSQPAAIPQIDMIRISQPSSTPDFTALIGDVTDEVHLSQTVVSGSKTSLLPDLRVKLMYLEMEGRQGNCVEVYTPYEIRVLVENIGLASAGPFAVDLNGTQLEVDGGLAASQVIEIHFAGTALNGQYKAYADVTNRVVEQQEDNNSLYFLAPTPPPPPLCNATSEPSSSNKIWKIYRNGIYGFTFEYPAIYDEPPYRDFCGLKEYRDGIQLGHQIQLLFLDSGGLNLTEYTNNLLQSKGWSVDSQQNEPINGVESIRVQYRFGSTNRFGTFTLVKSDERIFAFNFTAGSFCDIPESQAFEPNAYSHMIETFRVDK
jgi:hypothetical protein